MELPQQEETGGAGGLMNALLPEPPQDETAVTEYVTVRLSGVSDAELMKQLEEHLPDGAYTEPVDNSAYLLNLFLAYIPPILVMVGLFLFMFRAWAERAESAAWATWASPTPRSMWRKDRGHLPGCGWPGRGQGVPPGDHRHPP